MSKPMELSQAQVSERSFFHQVYLWVGVGLILSAVSAFMVASSPALIKLIYGNGIGYFVLFIVEIGYIFWLSSRLMHLSAPAAMAHYAAFTFINGLTLGFVFLLYTGASIVSTFSITAGTFIFFSVYGYATKADLTRWGQMALMGLIGIIVASLINMFFLKSTAMMMVITYIGIAIFLVLIAYKTQELKRIHQQAHGDSTLYTKLAIFGAISLYLSFINLFLLLLRIFGNRR